MVKFLMNWWKMENTVKVFLAKILAEILIHDMVLKSKRNSHNFYRFY